MEVIDQQLNIDQAKEEEREQETQEVQEVDRDGDNTGVVEEPVTERLGEEPEKEEEEEGEEETGESEQQVLEEQAKKSIAEIKTERWSNEFRSLFENIREDLDETNTITGLKAPELRAVDFLNNDKLKTVGLLDNTTTTVRSVLWRIWLGVLDRSHTERWAETTNKQRARYDNLRKSYIVNPRGEKDVVKKEADLFDDPLSTDKNSIWNQFFENENTQKEIGHDITRTYPGISFFERLDVQDSMTRILFIFSKQYPKIKYIQGMNEIVAPILYIAYRDSHWFDDRDVYFNEETGILAPLRSVAEHHVPENGPMPYVETSEDPVAKLGAFLRNSAYYEHDAYAMFETVMTTIGKWFMSPPNKDLPPPKVSGKYKEIYDKEERDAQAQTVNIVVVDECAKMFADIQYVEPQLYQYLKDISIDPHLYALRWIRILLAQIYPLSSLLCIWDALFKESISLLNYICISMLVSIKDSIIDRDYSECMQILFHYPIHIQDTQSLIETAFTLRDRISQIKKEQGSVLPIPEAKPLPTRARVYPQSFTQSIPPPKPITPVATTNTIIQPTPVTQPSPVTQPRHSISQSSMNYSNNNSNSASDSSLWPSTSGLFSTVTSTIKSIVNNLNEGLKETSGESNQQHIAKRLERLVFTLETVKGPDNSETIQSVQDELKSIRNLILPIPTTSTRSSSPSTQSQRASTQSHRPPVQHQHQQANISTTSSSQTVPVVSVDISDQSSGPTTEYRPTSNQPKVQQLVNITFPNIEFDVDDLKEVKTPFSTKDSNSSDSEDEELDSIQQEINFMGMLGSNLGFNKPIKKDKPTDDIFFD